MDSTCPIQDRADKVVLKILQKAVGDRTLKVREKKATKDLAKHIITEKPEEGTPTEVRRAMEYLIVGGFDEAKVDEILKEVKQRFQPVAEDAFFEKNKAGEIINLALYKAAGKHTKLSKDKQAKLKKTLKTIILAKQRTVPEKIFNEINSKLFTKKGAPGEVHVVKENWKVDPLVDKRLKDVAKLYWTIKAKPEKILVHPEMVKHINDFHVHVKNTPRDFPLPPEALKTLHVIVVYLIKYQNVPNIFDGAQPHAKVLEKLGDHIRLNNIS